MNVEDKIADSEKQLEQVDAPASNTKEGLEIANEQKEAEDKVYTVHRNPEQFIFIVLLLHSSY